MDVELTAAHWIYLAGIVVILATMAIRKNIVVPAVAATMLTAWAFSGSFVTGLSSIFNASLIAARELFNIFLIIALVTAMLGALRQMGADRLMVVPFRRVMRAGTSSFLVLAAVTYVISLFFWPTPAVPLVGAVLIPVAIRAGLSPLSVGMVIAIAGQGMALSSDYIIKVAPGISAKAAGVDPDAVADKALVLSLIVGVTALAITYVTQRRTWRKPSPELLAEWENEADNLGFETPDGPAPPAEGSAASGSQANPRRSAADRLPHRDGDSGARRTGRRSRTGIRKAVRQGVRLPGAAGVPRLHRVPAVGQVHLGRAPAEGWRRRGDRRRHRRARPVRRGGHQRQAKGFLETSSRHVVDGLVFAFKAMGIVMPIAGFFFIGNGDFSAAILGMPADATGPRPSCSISSPRGKRTCRRIRSSRRSPCCSSA